MVGTRTTTWEHLIERCFVSLSHDLIPFKANKMHSIVQLEQRVG